VAPAVLVVLEDKTEALGALEAQADLVALAAALEVLVEVKADRDAVTVDLVALVDPVDKMEVLVAPEDSIHKCGHRWRRTEKL